MKYLNGYVVASFVIYIVITFVVLVGYPEMPFLFWLFVGMAGVCLLGIILVVGGQSKTGAYIYLVGSIGFVPIGILGMVGARKVLDQLEQESFLRRKEAANE